jgi:hypothetical protein
MKIRKISNATFTLFLFFLFFLTIFSSTTANPVPPPPPLHYNLLTLYGSFLVLTFIIYSFLEYIVIFGYLKKSVKAGFKARIRLYIIIIAINFVTFPIVILMGTFFTPTLLPDYTIRGTVFIPGLFTNNTIEYVLLESVPITLETLFFLWAFNFLHEKGYLGSSVPKRKIFFATLAANILSFILGLIISPFYLFLYPPSYIFFGDITIYDSIGVLVLFSSFLFILLFLCLILFLVSHIELV